MQRRRRIAARNQPASSTLAWEFIDDGLHVSECPLGHQTLVDLQQQQIEAPFQIGAYATEDGYCREPVSSFTASFERFYKFFVRAATDDGGVGPPGAGRGRPTSSLLNNT
ncbi:hypothetical protein [Paraburkholderia sp. BL6669N2]|uniref:hypothetical protein n=1 Tax=Paraburkholderia sp. BL6669N2 TaxID=1938807 RepID=UPI0011C027D5|nr:hypothetical protein [Paraburkholderia sp. BL6669N2]